MDFKEIGALGIALIALAGLSVVIINGTASASVLRAGGEAFAGAIRAATLR